MNKKTTNQIIIEESEILGNNLLSAEKATELSPDNVIDILKQGNNEFTQNKLTVRNNTERARAAALGQYPKAVVLSCLDSRVPVEDIFHRGIGEIFVVRIAGNIVNNDILASLEFACGLSTAKVVLVLGHEDCGAIKAAIEKVNIGSLSHLLNKIMPAVEFMQEHFKGEKTVTNHQFTDAVCKINVENTIEEIRRRSKLLNTMEQRGTIKIIGAVYEMKTGKVEFISTDRKDQLV